jgi:hypothetical protein
MPVSGRDITPSDLHYHKALNAVWLDKISFFVFFLSLGGVRLSPLGTPATSGTVVPAPDDRWVWRSLWHGNWQGKPKYSEKAFLSATLSTTNPTWPDPGSNPGRHVGKSATNRLSYDTALRCLNYVSISGDVTRTETQNCKWIQMR